MNEAQASLRASSLREQDLEAGLAASKSKLEAQAAVVLKTKETLESTRNELATLRQEHDDQRSVLERTQRELSDLRRDEKVLCSRIEELTAALQSAQARVLAP